MLSGSVEMTRMSHLSSSIKASDIGSKLWVGFLTSGAFLVWYIFRAEFWMWQFITLGLWYVGLMWGGLLWPAFRKFFLVMIGISAIGVGLYQLGYTASDSAALYFFFQSSAMVYWMSAAIVISAAGYYWYLFSGNKISGDLGHKFAWVAATLGYAALAIRWQQTYIGHASWGHIPVTNMYDVMVLLCATTTLFYLYYESLGRTCGLGAFAMPMIFMAAIFLVWVGFAYHQNQIQPIIPALQSFWLKIHIPMEFVAYANFYLAGMVGIAYLLKTCLLTFFSRQSDGRMVHTRIEQTQRQLWLPKSPVEAVDELVQVLLQVFAGDPVESTQQAGLEVADGDVYPGKPFVHPFRRSDTAFMLLGLPQNAQCHQAIRVGGLPWKQMALGKLADILCGYRWCRFHGNEAGFFATAFHGYQDRCFPFRAPSALASGPSPAYESVVQLHEASQAIDAVPIGHGVAHLAQHPVSRDPGYPDLLGQSQGRQTPLVADHQIDREKPLHQRNVAGVKKRAGRHRGLMAAATTLIDLTGRYPMTMVMLAFRTLKATGPALLLQCFHTGLFRAKPLLPLNQIHRFSLHLRPSYSIAYSELEHGC